MSGPVDLGLGHIRIAGGPTEARAGAGSHYGPAGGTLELRQALAEWERVDEESVCITTGASLGLVATLATLDRPGTVLCPRPYYPPYPTVARMLGLGVAFYELDATRGWLPDLDRLGSMLDHTTRAILWNFPHNPTGACAASGHLLRRVQEMVSGRDIIVRGDLSVVGPRPEQPQYVEELEAKIPFYRLRHLVRPGLTGWAQVKYPYGASEGDALEKLQYEFYYLRHQGLALDLRVTGRTLRSVLGRAGR